MSESSPSIDEIARASYSAVLRALEKPKAQALLAEAVGSSESTISRWKNEHLQNDCTNLAALGFRIVATTQAVVSRRFLDSVIVIAKDGIESIHDSYDLERKWL